MMKKLKNKTEGLFNFIDYRKLGFKIFYYLLLLSLVVIIIIGVFPPLWVILSGFKEPRELFSTEFTLFPKNFNFSKIVDSWNRLNVGKYYLNSLFVIFGSIFSAVTFNGLLAYVISVLKPKGHKLIFVTVMLTMMIPAIVNMSALLQNISRLNLMQSYLPIWLSYGANAFYFIIFKVYFDRLPKELIEAAEIDGCNKLQIFTKLIFPLSLPIVMVVAIFTLNASWSDFLLPYLVLQSVPEKQTLMVRIFTLYQNPPVGMTQDQFLMLIGLSIIPVLILFGIFQKQITSNVAETGIK